MELNKELADQFGTDKGVHCYMPLYHKYISRFRDDPVKLLEIGVAGGGSLRMWGAFFAKGTIYGIDKSLLCRHFAQDNIKVYIGDVKDRQFVGSVVKEMGEPDIVIDDGSHAFIDQKFALDYFYPGLKDGGVYVIEDLAFDSPGYVPGLLYNLEYEAVHIYRRPSHDIMILTKGDLRRDLGSMWPVEDKTMVNINVSD